MAGLESAGKSALFRGLSGQITGDETNFRGSTVFCRTCHLEECDCDLVDTPGIRTQSDSQTTRMALKQIGKADVVLLVVRGTHLRSEMESLLREVEVVGRRSVLAITFEDKAPKELAAAAENLRKQGNMPVVLVNAKELHGDRRTLLLQALRDATPTRVNAFSWEDEESLSKNMDPPLTWLEHRAIGPLLSLGALASLFALPVYLAFVLANFLQPWIDGWILEPLKEVLAQLPPLLFGILAGNYGIFTLGMYSFLWAFPVVVLIGLSVAVAEESGLKDRISASLDPWLRHLGLSGRDLIPILTGFGCNVVAIFQSRSCSSCSRKNCVSLIAFGSACSYQIGASLALFNTSGHPWLFAPYLLILFIVGALHTRLWRGPSSPEAMSPLTERAFLQKPSWRAVNWRTQSVIKQFLKQAMPIFLLICFVSALLQYTGWLDIAALHAKPLLSLFGLPGEAGPGLLFSILRKDGLLVLNQDQGVFLQSLSAGQVLVLVYLASTLTACLVTLWTVRQELGGSHAVKLASRQALTSLVTTWLLARAVA